jgi:hypothetical protein
MFRFTIRDVLWLTVVVAASVAWWIDHRSHRTLRKERDSAINRLTMLTNMLERRGLEVFVDDRRAVIARKDGGSVTSTTIAEFATEPNP